MYTYKITLSINVNFFWNQSFNVVIFHSNILPNSYFRFAFAQAIHETCQLSSTKLNISILIFKQNLRNSRLATAIYYLLQLSFCVRTGRYALIGYWKRHWPISWKWSVFPRASALVFPASCRAGHHRASLAGGGCRRAAAAELRANHLVIENSPFNTAMSKSPPE